MEQDNNRLYQILRSVRLNESSPDVGEWAEIDLLIGVRNPPETMRQLMATAMLDASSHRDEHWGEDLPSGFWTWAYAWEQEARNPWDYAGMPPKPVAKPTPPDPDPVPHYNGVTFYAGQIPARGHFTNCTFLPAAPPSLASAMWRQ